MTLSHNLKLFAASALCSLALGGCASKGALKMEHAPMATAAQSKISVTQTKAGTAAIKFEVKHLAKPEKVKEGTKIYVAWARPTDKEGMTMNVGSFTPDNDLKASLETVTPYREFQFFITPESEKTAMQPSSEPLLWTEVKL